MILVDAGPLVALIDADDRHHRACRETMKKLRPRLLTVWPAVVEAMYLLGDFKAQDDLWQMLLAGVPAVANLDRSDFKRMRELMAKYRDLPMDLADAALVRVAEREHIRSIFTIDRKDFQTYRAQGIGSFAILP